MTSLFNFLILKFYYISPYNKMSSEKHQLTEKQMREFMSIKGAKGLKQKYDLEHSKGNTMLGSGMKGEGFFEDVGNWLWTAGKDVNQFLKDTKAISKVSGLAKYILPVLGMPEFIPLSETISNVANNMGYGRMVEVRHPKHLKHYQHGGMSEGIDAQTLNNLKHNAFMDMIKKMKVSGKGECECSGEGYTPGLSTTGMGATSNDRVLTVSRNGTLQMTAPTHLTNPGIGILANGRVDAGAPSLSGIKSGLGKSRMTGCGIGAFGVVSPVSGIKIHS